VGVAVKNGTKGRPALNERSEARGTYSVHQGSVASGDTARRSTVKKTEMPAPQRAGTDVRVAEFRRLFDALWDTDPERALAVIEMLQRILDEKRSS
jgi:hypothetical protein